MRDVVQVLSRIVKISRSRKHHSKKFSAGGSGDVDARSSCSENPDHQRLESVDSLSDLPEV
jgi:hypothetical protein